MCPHCDYVHARGDQCENCGKLLEATQLIAAKCKVCKTIPEFVDSEHLFMDLPKIEAELKVWVESVEEGWTENAQTTTKAWFNEGLKQRCITRDLKWGIAVPKPGFEDKVFYSWFDAPIAYIGITRECKKDWEHKCLSSRYFKDSIILKKASLFIWHSRKNCINHKANTDTKYCARDKSWLSAIRRLNLIPSAGFRV